MARFIILSLAVATLSAVMVSASISNAVPAQNTFQRDNPFHMLQFHNAQGAIVPPLVGASSIETAEWLGREENVTHNRNAREKPYGMVHNTQEIFRTYLLPSLLSELSWCGLFYNEFLLAPISQGFKPTIDATAYQKILSTLFDGNEKYQRIRSAHVYLEHKILELYTRGLPVVYAEAATKALEFNLKCIAASLQAKAGEYF